MGIQEAKQAAGAAPPADLPTAVVTMDAPPSVAVPNYYCLGKDHAVRLVTVERFFHWAGEVHPLGHPKAGQLRLVEQGPGLPLVPITSTCPICPVCTEKGGAVDPFTGRLREARVSAVPLEYDEAGNPQIPRAIQAIAQRAGEA
jgi:hypothetical protein